LLARANGNARAAVLAKADQANEQKPCESNVRGDDTLSVIVTPD